MITGPATKEWNGTNIENLKAHYLVEGHALCSTKLHALFGLDSHWTVDCKNCLKKAGA